MKIVFACLVVSIAAYMSIGMSYAQLSGDYLDIHVELVDVTVTDSPWSNGDLLMYDFSITNNGFDPIGQQGFEVAMLGFDSGYVTLGYPRVWGTSGQVAFDCPEYIPNFIGAKLTVDWRVCFEVTPNFTPHTLIVYTNDITVGTGPSGETYNVSFVHPVAFSWHSTCGDDYLAYCAPYTLDGSMPLGCWAFDSFGVSDEPARLWACYGDPPKAYSDMVIMPEADFWAYHEEFRNASQEPEQVTATPTTDKTTMITYKPSDNPIHYGLSLWAQDHEDEIINHEFLAEHLVIPDDLTVEFADCGTVNAFYNPTGDRIIMCHEFMTWVAMTTIASPDRYDRTDMGEATSSILRWVFMHELGHALIDQYDLAITGKEENAADQFATIMLLEDEGNDGPVDIVYMLLFFAEDGGSVGSYWDRHGFTLQRFYDTACLVAGKHGDGYPGILDLIPDEREVWCGSEYNDAVHAWDTLLADYRP